ncbi:PAS domain S-box protein [Allochromatium palmeri]|uniref:histidine kinase n=1 Tax=Allochromatium palmeri TaxID=231048 RepID=A0A6N8E9P7_9GAMM|nr:ATP-binding protein [Allochromatium palmeri]MTW20261.1 PAS domain S-box protein [Allochromatium palmeri]
MQHSDSQRRGLLLAALILLASGWLAAFGITLWRLHDKAVQDGFAAARMHARHFEDYLTKTLQVIDLSVGNLPPDQDLQDSQALTAHLTGLLRPSPFLRSLSILTLDGQVIASSDARNLGLRIDLDGFYPEAGLGGTAPRIGRPWVGRDLASATPSTGEPPPPRASSFVPVMHGFTLDGERYWWLAALNPDDFIDHFSQLLPIEEGRVQLLRYDGLLLLSSSSDDIPGRRDQAGKVPAWLERQELGELTQTLVAARRVLTAYRASSRYPVVIAVHLDQRHIQGRWLDEVLRLSMIVVPILAALSVAILLLWLRRRRLEQQRAELERQRRMTSSVFEASSDAIILTTPSGEILSTNPAFERMTGYSRAEARGRNPRFLSSGRHGQIFYRELWDAVVTQGHWRGEIVNRRQDGELYTALLTIDAVRDEHGEIQHYVGVTSDITERKRHEAELLAAKERAESAARAKTTFLSTMSHELRTPMHGILGMTQLLLESDLSERQRRQLETVKRSADALLAILADILDYTRMDAEDIPLQTSPVDPLQVVREVVALLRSQADKKGLRLDLESEATAFDPVLIDAPHLRQLLTKLTANAIKFTHEGEIILSVRIEPESTDARTLVIVVADTGIGIPDALHERIFEPFIQADGSDTRRYGGTGLGLAIARRLAEAMGGTLTVESAPDQVSRFTLRIPVQPLANRLDPSSESLPG